MGARMAVAPRPLDASHAASRKGGADGGSPPSFGKQPHATSHKGGAGGGSPRTLPAFHTASHEWGAGAQPPYFG